MTTEKHHPAAVALVMFYLGAFSMIAQVTFMREMFVVFYGNELSIATILASWLIGIGVGAVSSRFAWKLRRVSWVPVLLCLLPGLLFPLQVCFVRTARSIFGVPPGEYASFGVILASSVTIFFPTCFCIGFMFPTACEMVSGRQGQGSRDAGETVSLIYRMEAFGSMLAGVIMTFLLVPFISPCRIVTFAMILSFSAAGVLVQKRMFRIFLNTAFLTLVLLFALYPAVARKMEARSVEARWKSFGVSGAGDTLTTKLAGSRDTKYQNLAVTELEGQYVLYGNGRVMFAFPDKNSYEHGIHFIMAQNIDAKRVLLLGGNPVGEIPELLKYNLEKLVYVEMDPGVGELVREIMPAEYDEVMRDPRVNNVSCDALKFVLECKDRFDAVIINAPEPSTSSANRFYTSEFYRAVENIMEKDGFVYTSIISSERMQSTSLDFSASIYKSLKSVFPEVLLTYETQKRFIAGHKKSENGGQGITFDRAVLYSRSKNAGIPTEYFMPEYFLGLDDIDPVKTQEIAERCERAEAKENTLTRPVAYYYNLLSWSTFSESSLIKPLIFSMQRFTSRGVSAVVLFLSVFILSLSLVFRRAPLSIKGAWIRLLLLILLALTGFCGMGLEVIMIFVFQSLYGYVYTRMGLIVAVFMAGLVSGAQSARYFLGLKRYNPVIIMLILEGILLCVIFFVSRLLHFAAMVTGAGFVELLIYLAVAVTGWVVGAQFPVVNAILVEAGGGMGASASSSDAADHIGAAAGAVAAGVFLVPVLGVAGACVVMASCAAAGMMLICACLLARI